MTFEQSKQIQNLETASDDAIESCCAHCKTKIEKTPERALWIREQCLFETRVTDYQTGAALSWD